MPATKEFYDLLFETSNETRHNILLLLQRKTRRITDIAKDMDLNNPEARRHLFRLRDAGLIVRDYDGFYRLTPYGETVLLLHQEYYFLSKNREYFQTHTLSKVPTKLVKQIGKLSESRETQNAMDFLRKTDNLFKASMEYVWLLVDQFPLNSLSTIMEAIERGVQFKIIEPRDGVLSPDLDSMTSEETQALSRTRHTPLVEQRIVDEVNVFLYLSDGECVLAFPTDDGQYDYKGFTATDDSSLGWCRELFQHFWEKGEHSLPTDMQVKCEPASEGYTRDQIVLEGRNDPNIDAKAIQDAVDNFDEVILRGRFNLGTTLRRTLIHGSTCVLIRRSITIRGEGREDDVPTTKIAKSSWVFPTQEFDTVFEVDGDGIDVTIENLHIQEFNGCSIVASRGNSVKIRNNRITLRTGLGRGQTFGHMGDRVTGITIWGPEGGGFPGGAVIEGNYLDFAMWYEVGGFIPRKKVVDPNYRPDHESHETYTGTGILVNGILGKVVIRDNVIRNMNAKGIVFQDNHESSEILVTGNKIISEIFGSYPFSTHIAGFGIQGLGAWSLPVSGSRVEISGNEVRCDKLNYSGIAIYGMSMYKEGASKLEKCVVRDNNIHLGDGHVGLLIRKNDETEVDGNKISGRSYYGIHLWGSEDREGFDLGSNANLIEDNDLSELKLKAPDEYSDSNVDGRMFTGSEGRAETAHVWLNVHTRGNVIKLKPDETVIDEGEENDVSYE